MSRNQYFGNMTVPIEVKYDVNFISLRYSVFDELHYFKKP